MMRGLKIGSLYLSVGKWYVAGIVNGSTASIGVAVNVHHIIGIDWSSEIIADEDDRTRTAETKIYVTILPLVPIVIQIDRLTLTQSKAPPGARS